MKRKSGRKSDKNATKQNGMNQNDTDSIADDAGETQEKRGRKTRGRKSIHNTDSEPELETSVPEATSTPETDPLAPDDDDEYEVEAIIDEKIKKGVRHYLIRWKGYTEESDTWEPEDTLACESLIKEFKRKAKKRDKGDKKEKVRRPIQKEKKGEKLEESWNENEDFEVDRILDVYFHKSGKKDFLVSWKGYPASQNSWEPEENMDCTDLIAKYMAKVQQARQYDEKELRVSRRPVNRLDFPMHESKRRLSKRHTGKQRVHYFDAE
ncbi:chromobox protein homolog 1-like [Euwallacea fornicatus]|uniref:chromobox protein homolog 1-like n=1 Tax=Euwallacea fornicatus TaxID=995702 RepID=UPI00338F545B